MEFQLFLRLRPEQLREFKVSLINSVDSVSETKRNQGWGHSTLVEHCLAHTQGVDIKLGKVTPVP